MSLHRLPSDNDASLIGLEPTNDLFLTSLPLQTLFPHLVTLTSTES